MISYFHTVFAPYVLMVCVYLIAIQATTGPSAVCLECHLLKPHTLWSLENQL